MKLTAIAFSLMALAVAAGAQEAKTSVVVSYGDLNLRSESGLKTLDARLAHAIRTVCAEHDGSVVPEHRFAVQHCVTEKRAEVAALRDRAIANQPQALASR